MTVGSGTVRIRAPRVNDKRVDEESGERRRFSSEILPAYARRSPKVTDVTANPLLARPVDRRLRPRAARARQDASGLSASSIQRLTEAWQAEHAAFRERSLRFHRFAYLLIEGVVRHEALLNRPAFVAALDALGVGAPDPDCRGPRDARGRLVATRGARRPGCSTSATA